MKLGIDVDGVLADFATAYGRLLIDITGRNLLPEGWDIADNPNWPTTWYWEREAGYTKDEENLVWKQGIYSTNTFWENLEPLPTAVASLERLLDLQKEGHDIYFLTHRSGKRAKYQTETFLVGNGMRFPTVLLTGTDKTPLINGLGLNFFIDDKPTTVADVAEKCKVKHLFLKAAPYNTEMATAKRVASIQEALETVGLWNKSQ